jgi:hypothetical protein
MPVLIRTVSAVSHRIRPRAMMGVRSLSSDPSTPWTPESHVPGYDGWDQEIESNFKNRSRKSVRSKREGIVDSVLDLVSIMVCHFFGFLLS